ncbi:uncharacterized protein LOC127847429 [Dreissena polymorpha]|uniref:LRAT domain-containing protein n=1 Tax=Dreissena polymorpha TaxID=45954 RepID=A0A9D4DVQ5_DREPO|nr:uncharacterized protein LOC127847429 [Dreissena polymorpha]KAH3755210.1 hypothetical protein DPMN_189900 [Dreissena polymorpha]
MKLLLILVAVFVCVATVKCCKEQLESGLAVPFYYGHSNLSCTKGKGKNKGKRSLNTVSTTRLVHRFVYYCGYYFEWIDEGVDPFGTSPLGRNCNPEIYSEPAGYSRVKLECAKNCAKKFSRNFQYHMLNNNCHHFANTMASFLDRSDGECCNN